MYVSVFHSFTYINTHSLSLSLARSLRLIYTAYYYIATFAAHTYIVARQLCTMYTSIVVFYSFSHCVYIGISHAGRWYTQFWIAADSVRYSANWMAGWLANDTYITIHKYRIGKITSIQKSSYTRASERERKRRGEGGRAVSEIVANKEPIYI